MSRPVLPVHSGHMGTAQENSSWFSFSGAKKVASFCKDTIKDTGILMASRVGGAVGYAALKTTTPTLVTMQLKKVLSASIGSSAVRDAMGKYVHEPLRHMIDNSPSLMGGAMPGNIVTGAVMEEVLFRGLLHEVLLKELPERFTGNEEMTERAAVIAARIGITSLVFALSHTDHWAEGISGCVPQLIGGVISSYYLEKNGPKALIPLVVSHIAWNTLIIYALEAI